VRATAGQAIRAAWSEPDSAVAKTLLTLRSAQMLERTGTDASVSKYIFGSFVAGQKNNKDFGIVKYITINKQSKQ
jgi:hypothetical protein